MPNRFVDAIGKDSYLQPLWRYGLALAILALVLINVNALLSAPKATTAAVNNVCVALMLLLSHVAFGFPWPYRTRVFLRICALVSVLVVCVFYFSHRPG
jgi:hypothetical protein